MNTLAPALKHTLTLLSAREHLPLAPLCTLKAGGKARFFVEAQTTSALILLQKACLEHNVALHVLSGGSNTLFSDAGFSGVVVKLGTNFAKLRISEDGLSMEAGSATSFAKITKYAVSLGWAKAVGWSGTPGLLGGAVRMNAGTRMGEIKDALVRVYGVLLGEERIYERSDLEFGYRSNNLPSDLIITAADLAYKQELIEDVALLEAQVQEYRIKRRATQPSIASAGSFFKNPYKAFAAQLIENCNIKGLQYGGAQISSLHANFIVNNGGATANDILHIASIAQKAVFERFGIALLPEIRLVGDFNDSPLCISRFSA